MKTAGRAFLLFSMLLFLWIVSGKFDIVPDAQEKRVMLTLSDGSTIIGVKEFEEGGLITIRTIYGKLRIRRSDVIKEIPLATENAAAVFQGGEKGVTGSSAEVVLNGGNRGGTGSGGGSDESAPEAMADVTEDAADGDDTEENISAGDEKALPDDDIGAYYKNLEVLGLDEDQILDILERQTDTDRPRIKTVNLPKKGQAVKPPPMDSDFTKSPPEIEIIVSDGPPVDTPVEVKTSQAPTKIVGAANTASVEMSGTAPVEVVTVTGKSEEVAAVPNASGSSRGGEEKKKVSQEEMDPLTRKIKSLFDKYGTDMDAKSREKMLREIESLIEKHGQISE